MTTKIAIPHLAKLKARGEPITAVTVYDAIAARLVDNAGIELALVGDSAATTVLGYESTVPITIEEMLVLTKAVTRNPRRALVVADMPFGSYQSSDEAAVHAAIRLLKEGGADAVKLEGAGSTISRVRALGLAGIATMGHIGLTPQSAALLGGYKAQGRTAAEARVLCNQALALEAAGCFALVLEAMPAAVAARITASLTIPTIGIGAGLKCDGQILVWHDLLGLTSERLPRFVKQYCNIAETISEALSEYVSDVRTRRFPESIHTYTMPDNELEDFESSE